MEKTRVKKGEYHWYIKCLSDIDIDCITDDYDESDDRYFESGNYFHTREEAEAMARKLRAVLKGADVIKIPSIYEIDDTANNLDSELTCINEIKECITKNHTYMAGFLYGINWLESKIVK